MFLPIFSEKKKTSKGEGDSAGRGKEGKNRSFSRFATFSANKSFIESLLPYARRPTFLLHATVYHRIITRGARNLKPRNFLPKKYFGAIIHGRERTIRKRFNYDKELKVQRGARVNLLSATKYFSFVAIPNKVRKNNPQFYLAFQNTTATGETTLNSSTLEQALLSAKLNGEFAVIFGNFE